MQIAGREIERDTLVEIGVSAGAVGLFILVVLVIGATYDTGGLSREGAFALVGSIVLFILVMSGVGVWLAYQFNDPGDEA